MPNTSTNSPNSLLDGALANIPKTFRTKLIDSYLSIKKNSLEMRHDSAGMAVAKFCEVVLRHLQEKVHGRYTPFGTKIGNFADECRQLVNAPSTKASESERVVLPRALVFLYTMRNKRGIGHVGGDVDANAIDTATMARTADWILCELIRINHGLSLEEAQDLVDGLSVRQLPIIWEIGGKKRVLRDGLVARDQALLLLYSSVDSSVLLEDLCEWVEYSNPTVFKRNVIGALHKDRLLEFDRGTEAVTLSPKGIHYIETTLL